MPRLPTYDAPLGGLPAVGGRRASAQDFGADIGAALGNVAQAGQKVYNDIEASEARTALVRTTEIRAKYAKRLDEAANSSEDLEKIRQEMDDELSKVGDDFATPSGLDQLAVYSANTNAMFDEQANTIFVRRAGADAKLDATNFLNGAATLLQSNPLYLPVAERNVDDFVRTLNRVSPELRSAISQDLKLELNTAAAMASARIDPEATKQKLESGAWNLSPEARRQVIGQADTTIRAKRADENHQRELAREQRVERNEEARDEMFKGIMAGEQGMWNKVMDNPDLLAPTREHLIGLMEQRTQELKAGADKSNPLVMRNLFLRIHAEEGNPTRIFVGDPILDAVANGSLNTHDGERLLQLVAEQKDPNNRTIGSRLGSLMQTVGTALSQDPQFTAQPALVAEIQMDYQARVHDRMNNLRRSKSDPNEVFDSGSRQYVGSRQFIQQSIDAATQRYKQALRIELAPKTKEEYDAIPVGQPYVDTDGKRKIKGQPKQLEGQPKQPEGNRRESSGTIRRPGEPK